MDSIFEKTVFAESGGWRERYLWVKNCWDKLLTYFYWGCDQALLVEYKNVYEKVKTSWINGLWVDEPIPKEDLEIVVVQ